MNHAANFFKSFLFTLIWSCVIDQKAKNKSMHCKIVFKAEKLFSVHIGIETAIVVVLCVIKEKS